MTRHPTPPRMGTRAALAALAVLLAGCPSAPEIRYTPFEVQVPVKVPCAVDAPPEPKWAVGELPPDADDFTIAKAYREERRQREQYNREMQAAIATCKKGTTGSP
jgi:hypothetical protein